MDRSTLLALILGIVISMGLGIIKYETVNSLLESPSNALFFPPLIAGFVSSFVAMKGTDSRLGALGLGLGSVFIGTLTG